jgi:hypothetical protein
VKRTSQRIILTFGLLAAIVCLTACLSALILLLDAATIAAENVIPVFTSDPQAIACTQGIAAGLDQAGAELETSDSAAVKAQKIWGYLAGPKQDCLAITGLSPRATALIAALMSAVTDFLERIGPPPTSVARTLSTSPTGTAEKSVTTKPNPRIDAIRLRLRKVIAKCEGARVQ